MQPTVEKAVNQSLAAADFRGYFLPLMFSVVVGAGNTGDQTGRLRRRRFRGSAWGTSGWDRSSMKIATCRIALSDASGVR
jgi:hypothetical protein